MTIMKIQIEKDQDLTALKAVIEDLGLRYSIEEAEKFVTSIPAEALEGIHAGLNDLQEGRVLSHNQAMERIAQKIDQMRVKHAG
jgi:hypothetical protein